MMIDFFPDLSKSEIEQQVMELVKDNPKKAVKNALKSVMQERMLVFLLERAEIDIDADCVSVSQKKMANLR